MRPAPKPVKSKKPKKRKQKTEHKKLEEQCLKLWSLCVIARDRTCRATNSGERLSAHHIRGVSHLSTRYLIDNGLTLSWSVHFLQKANPERFMDIILNIIGQDFYDELKKKSLIVTDYTVEDLKDIKEHLKQELIRIKAL